MKVPVISESDEASYKDQHCLRDSYRLQMQLTGSIAEKTANINSAILMSVKLISKIVTLLESLSVCMTRVMFLSSFNSNKCTHIELTSVLLSDSQNTPLNIHVATGS